MPFVLGDEMDRVAGRYLEKGWFEAKRARKPGFLRLLQGLNLIGGVSDERWGAPWAHRSLLLEKSYGSRASRNRRTMSMWLVSSKTASSCGSMTSATFRSRLSDGDIRRATRTAVVTLLRGSGPDDLRPLRQLLWASNDRERLVVRGGIGADCPTRPWSRRDGRRLIAHAGELSTIDNSPRRAAPPELPVTTPQRIIRRG
jgi:hypothetical protein